jgi:hypothetical protein
MAAWAVTQVAKGLTVNRGKAFGGSTFTHQQNDPDDGSFRSSAVDKAPSG